MTTDRRKIFGAAATAVAGGLLPPAAVEAQTEPVRLKPEDMKKFLEGLGYEPEMTGVNGFRITSERGKFTFRINTSISGNTKKLWLSTFLLVVPDEKKTPDFLGKLLVANGEIGPAHFYLATVAEKTWLKVGYALDNRDITPKYFREEFDWFCERITEKAALWSPSA